MGDTEREVEEWMARMSSATGAAVQALEHSAAKFVSFSPLKKIRYFGFGLIVAAFVAELANALVPRFEFRSDIIIWILASGIFIIFSGALAEAVLRVVFARSALAQAKELDRKAGVLRDEGKTWLSGISQKLSGKGTS